MARFGGRSPVALLAPLLIVLGKRERQTRHARKPPCPLPKGRAPSHAAARSPLLQELLCKFTDYPWCALAPPSPLPPPPAVPAALPPPPVKRAPPAHPQAWEQLGPPLASNSYAPAVRLGADPEGALYAARLSASGNPRQITVERFSAAEKLWKPVGAPLPSLETEFGASFAFAVHPKVPHNPWVRLAGRRLPLGLFCTTPRLRAPSSQPTRHRTHRWRLATQRTLGG